MARVRDKESHGHSKAQCIYELFKCDWNVQVTGGKQLKCTLKKHMPTRVWMFPSQCTTHCCAVGMVMVLWYRKTLRMTLLASKIQGGS